LTIAPGQTYNALTGPYIVLHPVRRMEHLSLAHLTVLDATPLQLIDAAAAGGFDFIGLRIVPPTPADPIVPVVGDPQLIRNIHRHLHETGIRILDVETFWLSPQTRISDLVPAFETAAQLSARYLLVCGNDPDESRLIANLAALCEAARPLGLKAMLEFIPFCQTKTLAAALRVVAAAAQPNAGVLVDALHVMRSGGSPDGLRGVDPALLDYWQICDAPAAPPADNDLRTEARTRRLYPGEGTLPIGAMLDVLPSDIPIAVEAPCARYAPLPVVERGRLCGQATRAFLSHRRLSPTRRTT
jgi:sugar phosphate isomerase/epimerase